ncbi:GNAT family N-acetyltransferase [Vagococcus vulneris]|uniref:N-acetyltransferase domain-containing protein n=1 Tax=Vagococcus vulneris TaxID=1977869 RepID=A0A429ZZR5_9ENTE|nr:GNAT family N-acetyltransferase [Vagococcus vulneris]RST99516.1 hypothetical protein CBF37_04105 [Vagococcus vulneris]
MIRNAEKKDAKEVIPLIMIVLRDMELNIFQKLSEEEIISLLEIAYVEFPNYRYGYNRAIVKEIDSQIAGIAFGYPDEIEDTIDDDFIQLLISQGLSEDYRFFNEKECFADEWYLDTLVTSPHFRKQGVAAELLSALPKVAVNSGRKIIGLNCDTVNDKAKSVYLKQGFKKVGEMILADHHYNHLQLNID